MSLHDNLMRDGLVRPLEGRVLGGVCAGLGRRFGLDPWAARLLFVLALMIIPGSQLLIYPILWIVMPSEVRYAYYPPGAAPQYAQYRQGPAQYGQPQHGAGQYAPGQYGPAQDGGPVAAEPRA